MGEPSLQAVTVRLAHPGGSRAADREALLASVADVTRADPASTAVGRRCAHCGSDAHGHGLEARLTHPCSVRGQGVGRALGRTRGAAIAGGASCRARCLGCTVGVGQACVSAISATFIVEYWPSDRVA